MTFTKWQSLYLNQDYGDSRTSKFRIEDQLKQGDGGSWWELCERGEDRGKIMDPRTFDLFRKLGRPVSVTVMLLNS